MIQCENLTNYSTIQIYIYNVFDYISVSCQLAS